MSGGFPFETGKSAEGELLVSCKTPLTYENAAEIWQSLSGLVARKENTSLLFNLSGVSKIDSAGAALVRSVQRLCDRRGVRFRIESIDPGVKHFLDYLERETPQQGQPPPPAGSLVTRLGAFLIEQAAEAREFVRFCGLFGCRGRLCSPYRAVSLERDVLLSSGGGTQRDHHFFSDQLSSRWW